MVVHALQQKAAQNPRRFPPCPSSTSVRWAWLSYIPIPLEPSTGPAALPVPSAPGILFCCPYKNESDGLIAGFDPLAPFCPRGVMRPYPFSFLYAPGVGVFAYGCGVVRLPSRVGCWDWCWLCLRLVGTNGCTLGFLSAGLTGSWVPLLLGLIWTGVGPMTRGVPGDAFSLRGRDPRRWLGSR